MLKTRVILSALLIGILLGALLLDLHFDFAFASFAILVATGAGAAVEWNRIMAQGTPTYPGLLLAAALLYPLLEWLRIAKGWPASLTDFSFIFTLILLLFGRAVLAGHVKDGLDRIARTLLGFTLLYLFYRLAPLLLDRAAGGGVTLVYVLVLTSKSSDIGAFLTGYFFGKRKLIPKVSPGKTLAGAVGGIVLPIVAGTLLVWLLELRPLWFGPVFGGVIGTVTILSDLSESLVKRCAGVKDSASLLPEMGGILDLIDSLILAAPAGYLLLFHWPF